MLLELAAKLSPYMPGCHALNNANQFSYRLSRTQLYDHVYMVFVRIKFYQFPAVLLQYQSRGFFN